MLSDPKFLEHAKHTCLICHRMYFTAWAFVQHVKTHDYRQMDTMLCLHRLQLRCSQPCPFCDAPAHNPQLDNRCPTLVNLATFLAHGSPASYGPGQRYLWVNSDIRSNEGTACGHQFPAGQTSQNKQLTRLDSIFQQAPRRASDDGGQIGTSERVEPECHASGTSVPHPCESRAGQLVATDAGRDEAVACIPKDHPSETPSCGPHVGDAAETSRDSGKGHSTGCSVEGSRTDAADHQRWADAISSLGRFNQNLEAHQRCEDEHPRSLEGRGESEQASSRSQHNAEISRPHQSQGKPRQSSTLAMVGLQSKPARGMGRGASAVLSRHLAVGSMSGPTTIIGEVSAGQADSATSDLKVVRILLNTRNLCYVNAFITCLAWAAILMGGIELYDWPIGGFELFRTLTAMSGVPINLASFQPFLWLFQTGPCHGWTISDLEIQNDVTEFGHWFLGRTTPRFVNCQWVSQLLRLGHIEAQNGTERGDRHGPILLPMFDPHLKSCTLQTLIDVWHDGLGVCRSAEKVGHILILSISRYLPEFGVKNLQNILIPQTVRFPFFLNEEGAVHFFEYKVCGLIYHLGATPITGHYRAVLNCDNRWLNYEDGRLPDSLHTLTDQIQSNVVMLWLQPTGTTPVRTTLDGPVTVPSPDDAGASTAEAD